MAGKELLSDQGFRIDGRRPHELRKLECKLGVSNVADGSAYIEQGNTKVMVSVFGPHEITNRSKSNNQAVVNCEYNATPYSTGERRKNTRDRKSQELALILKQAFEGCIKTNLYPGSQIDICFLVLEADGGNCSACINGGTLALIDAGIPIKDYLCACSAGFAIETPLTDISHLEGMMGGNELNIAMLPRSEALVCMELTARLHIDHFNRVLQAAMKGCRDIHIILDAAVRKCAIESQYH